jgi:hypothetical protein
MPLVPEEHSLAFQAWLIVPEYHTHSSERTLQAALDQIGARDLTNSVVEVKYVGDRILCSVYRLQKQNRGKAREYKNAIFILYVVALRP